MLTLPKPFQSPQVKPSAKWFQTSFYYCSRPQTSDITVKQRIPVKDLSVRDSPLLFFMKVGVNASHTELVVDQILVSPSHTWNSPVIPPTQLIIVLQLIRVLDHSNIFLHHSRLLLQCHSTLSFALSRSRQHNPALTDLSANSVSLVLFVGVKRLVSTTLSHNIILWLISFVLLWWPQR